MADDLPAEFDLVVIGTGFTESCIAAGASRIGKTVLHLDRQEFYGGAWASFNLENFITILQQGNFSDELQNASFKWHITNKPAENKEHQMDDDSIAGEESVKNMNIEQTENECYQEDLLAQSRRFNLDLSPKLLYAAGSLVQLLVSSNICRYAEFRAIDNVCTLFRDELLSVPCSRSDVFNSKDLSIVEKRLLMKVLNDCLVYGEEKRDEDELKFQGKTFQEYLLSQKVTEKIAVCIMQAIAMCNSETSFVEGMARIQRFLQSLGRYGNTPFLFPMYGCGEMPQCFCRLCAVFGGIYCLKCPILGIDYNKESHIVSLTMENGKTIRAQHVVSSHGNMPKKIAERICGSLVNKISRGVFICSTPLGDEKFNAGGGGVNLLRLIAADNEAIVLQLSHYSGCCPKDFFVFHITTPARSNKPDKDLEPFMSQIFNNKPHAPTLLFSAYFTLTGRLNMNTATDNIPIYCTDAPFYELDYDLSIDNAREIFKRMYADSEFLPRAPDPEEIVVDGEDPRALSEVSLPEDLRAQLHELERSAGKMEIESCESTTGSIPQRMDAE